MSERMERPTSVPAEARWSEKDQEWILGAQDPDGQLHGPVRYWREDGTLCCTCNREHGQMQGSSTRYHPTGEVSETCSYEGGELHGTHTWLPSSAPTTESMHSPRMSRTINRVEVDHDRGRMAAIRYFVDGHRVNVDGSPMEPRPVTVPENACYNIDQHFWVSGIWGADGSREGVMRYWDCEGNFYARERYVRDVAEGLAETFREDGAPRNRSMYAHGIYHGTCETFRRDGSLLRRGEFAEDQYHGRLELFDERGEMVRAVEFDHGRPVRVERTGFTTETRQDLPARAGAWPVDLASDPRVVHLPRTHLERLPDEAEPLLQSTEVLALEDNRLEKVPDWLGRLPRLKHLDLSGNPLRDPESVVQSLGQSRTLERLVLRGVGLRRLPLDGDGFPALRSLDISGNPIQELPLDLVAYDLHQVDLDDCPIRPFRTGAQIAAHLRLVRANVEPEHRRLHFALFMGRIEKTPALAVSADIALALNSVDGVVRASALVALRQARPNPLRGCRRALRVALAGTLRRFDRASVRGRLERGGHRLVTGRSFDVLLLGELPGAGVIERAIARGAALAVEADLGEPPRLSNPAERRVIEALENHHRGTYGGEEEAPGVAALQAVGRRSVSSALRSLLVGHGWTRDADLDDDVIARECRAVFANTAPDALWAAAVGLELPQLPRLWSEQRMERVVDGLAEGGGVDRGRLEQHLQGRSGRGLSMALRHGGDRALEAIRRKINDRHLDLSHANLTAVPPEIARFPHVRSLDLTSNRLRTLPREIGDMWCLNRLDLRNNTIVGLPREMTFLGDLRTLYLHGNALVTVPPTVCLLSDLTLLNLGDNLLEELPESICELRDLRDLSLYNNPLRFLPRGFERLSNLRFLHLGGLQLESVPESIYELHRLETLWVASPHMKCLPAGISRLTKLRELIFWSSAVEQVPDDLYEMTWLRAVRIRGNPLGETVLARLKEALPGCRFS